MSHGWCSRHCFASSSEKTFFHLWYCEGTIWSQVFSSFGLALAAIWVDVNVFQSFSWGLWCKWEYNPELPALLRALWTSYKVYFHGAGSVCISLSLFMLFVLIGLAMLVPSIIKPSGKSMCQSWLRLVVVGGLVLKPQHDRVFPMCCGTRMGSEMHPQNTNNLPRKHPCFHMHQYTHMNTHPTHNP